MPGIIADSVVQLVADCVRSVQVVTSSSAVLLPWLNEGVLVMFWAQAELEDLCFAVMNPREYRVLRSELDTIWGLPPLSPTSIADAAEKALTSHTAQTPPSDPAPGGPTMLARTSGTSSQAAQGPCAPSQLRACMEAPAAESGQAGPSSNVLTVPGALSSAARRNKDAAVAVSSASADLHTVDQTEHGTHAPSRKPSRSTARGLGSAMEGPGLPAASVGVSGSTAAGSMASVAGAAGSSTAAEERTGGESASGRAATCNLNLTPEQAEVGSGALSRRAHARLHHGVNVSSCRFRVTEVLRSS